MAEKKTAKKPSKVATARAKAVEKAQVTKDRATVSLKWVLIAENTATGQEEVAIGWGAILASLITLIATALVIYLFIHFAKLDRLDKKKES
ncbi:MAG: hypothetical protein EOO17_04020 [Chloroflexi bacterium]|nr:MAG: hypothetical protein EOO17_04020 [Chloroflexota bacterium]